VGTESEDDEKLDEIVLSHPSKALGWGTPGFIQVFAAMVA
jgi:hypothetical protein